MLGGVTVTAAGTVAKLAGEVSQADPWAMIDKIKNATTKNDTASADNDNAEHGANAVGNNGATAANKADFAAAVALKSMIKNGKLNANAGDISAVKAVATIAVNKVLGTLDLIIRKTVESKLEEARKAVKE
ncbi:variable large family protein [Borrelia coriaceae]|uniref:Variable large protein n=1 Tax=Borrelia coriaceae ATCC 43381 TaxID=1408429 RepID=W5SX35_9SPIR|nr:variable large family protein [Borrelia coriaceae]AHH11268.1 Variable major protein [Borrelia coriaceae ATCC 43381]